MKKDDAMPPRRGHGPLSKEQKHLRGQRRLLAEWRGTEEPEDLSRFEKPIATIVQKVLQKAGLEDRLEHSQIAAQWASVVGDFLSRHSRPVSLRRGILHIAVVQAAVRYDMERRMKSEILAKLKTRFGTGIRGLKFENG